MLESMTPPESFVVRAARRDDVPAIEQLIERSVRELSADWYAPEQIESALRFMFGVDTQLVDDGTYYVVQRDGVPVAAGGWSQRRTLFGGDRWKRVEDARLDPEREPARIRAFFVDPAWARHGLGRMLFERALREARLAQFSRMELMATLPGEPLYRALGFGSDERIEFELPDGVKVPLVRMSRDIGR
jgi:GNAT superfamily N-acetyltransferase